VLEDAAHAWGSEWKNQGAGTLANKNVDYREVCCPVCEQVCDDAIWIPQNVLLANRSQIESLCDGLRKVMLRVNDG